jgi:hypothetical protein
LVAGAGSLFFAYNVLINLPSISNGGFILESISNNVVASYGQNILAINAADTEEIENVHAVCS